MTKEELLERERALLAEIEKSLTDCIARAVSARRWRECMALALSTWWLVWYCFDAYRLRYGQMALDLGLLLSMVLAYWWLFTQSINMHRQFEMQCATLRDEILKSIAEIETEL